MTPEEKLDHNAAFIADVLHKFETVPGYPLGESDPMIWSMCWSMAMAKLGYSTSADLKELMVTWFANAMTSAQPNMIMGVPMDQQVITCGGATWLRISNEAEKQILDTIDVAAPEYDHITGRKRAEHDVLTGYHWIGGEEVAFANSSSDIIRDLKFPSGAASGVKEVFWVSTEGTYGISSKSAVDAARDAIPYQLDLRDGNYPAPSSDRSYQEIEELVQYWPKVVFIATTGGGDADHQIISTADVKHGRYRDSEYLIIVGYDTTDLKDASNFTTVVIKVAK